MVKIMPSVESCTDFFNYIGLGQGKEATEVDVVDKQHGSDFEGLVCLEQDCCNTRHKLCYNIKGLQTNRASIVYWAI